MKSAKTKNYQSFERWMIEKKVGRLRQAWVWDEPQYEFPGPRMGHWEHI